MRVNPNESQAYAFRADTYIALKKYNEASDDIIKALSIDYNRKALGLIDGAKLPFKDILLAKLRIQQAKDKNVSLWSVLQGTIYEESEEYQAAIKVYQAANAINTTNGVYYRLSICHYELGEFNDALDAINHAIAMDSTKTHYY